ncbi:MAG: ankyrin repeat domain-containing protein [Solirubrobacteraceae bacterium]
MDEAALRAVADGDVERLGERLGDGIEVGARDRDRGYTLLHVAAGQLNLKACRMLLDAGADPNAADRYGNGPLWIAVFNDRGGVKDGENSPLVTMGIPHFAVAR